MMILDPRRHHTCLESQKRYRELPNTHRLYTLEKRYFGEDYRYITNDDRPTKRDLNTKILNQGGRYLTG